MKKKKNDYFETSKALNPQRKMLCESVHYIKAKAENQAHTFIHMYFYPQERFSYQIKVE